MARKPTLKLTATTATRNDPPKQHFFLSSLAEWRTGYDLGALIAAMKLSKLPFNVWLVPGPKGADYEIQMFAPQVEGAIWLCDYLTPKEPGKVS
jgi:hypothetical protein